MTSTDLSEILHLASTLTLLGRISLFHQSQIRRIHFDVPKNKEGVQFLSDELSEVRKNLKLTVQFLSDDFAAVVENISAEF